jgi:hypothetical protein
MAFGRQEPVVGENASARAEAAGIFEEFAALKAQADQVTENVTKGVGDPAENVSAFQVVSEKLRRNQDALTTLKNSVFKDEKVFDATLGRQLQETIKQTQTYQTQFEPTGKRAENAVNNTKGNDPAAGSTQGDGTTTDKDVKAGTTEGKSGTTRDDRDQEVGKTNDVVVTNGDATTARLNGVGLAAGGVPKNMEDLNRSLGVSVRTGFGQGSSTGVAEDWRVRISLATNSNIFYKSKNPGIQSPLLNTSGVVFPYTPSISVTHNANYGQTKLTHSNYASFFYEGSEISAINISGDFTVQSEEEGKYVLAALTFFRSCTKMWFGTQNQPLAGNPPPMVFLNGYGRLYFPHVPCVITSFQHTMPAEVDYIEIVHSADEINPFGRTKTGGQSKSQIELLNNASTRVPTNSTLSITVQPIYSRKFVHENFNLDSFATGELLVTRGGFI